MATKPSLGAYVWAPDALYTTGPAPLIGTATKITPPASESDEGWNADQKPAAQWANFSINYLTQWASDWVRLGSNAAGADAHIVETDSAGVANVVDLTAGGFSQRTSARGTYGDGSDGALAVGGGTTTLTRDTYYTTIDLNATDIIETNGFRLFANGTVTIAAGGLIRHNGNDGQDGSAGGAGGGALPVNGSLDGGKAGGAGGTTGTGSAGANSVNSVGGSGGIGGASSSDAGGSAGSATPPVAGDGGHRHISAALGYVVGLVGGTTVLQGGGGGGGGGGDPENSDTGGGGGGGGGVMVLHLFDLVNNGSIRANGGRGGSAELGGANDPGGGAGGGGGAIFLVTRISAGIGTVLVNGGAAGAGGDGSTAPTAATVGEIILLGN